MEEIVRRLQALELRAQQAEDAATAAQLQLQQAEDTITQLTNQIQQAPAQPAVPAAALAPVQQIIDTRQLGKPSKLEGKDLMEWRMWSFVFLVYCAAIDPELHDGGGPESAVEPEHEPDGKGQVGAALLNAGTADGRQRAREA